MQRSNKIRDFVRSVITKDEQINELVCVCVCTAVVRSVYVMNLLF